MISTCLKKHFSIKEQYSKIDKEFKDSSLSSINLLNLTLNNVSTKDRFFHKIISKEIYQYILDKKQKSSINGLELKKMINSGLIDGPTILKITDNKCEDIFGKSFELKNSFDLKLFDTSMISFFGITTKTLNRKSILFFENEYQVFLFKRLSYYSLFILKIN